MKTTLWTLGLVVLGTLAGCYHYVPTDAATSRPGTPVRAQLDTMSAFELAQITVNNIDEVEGEMVRVDAGELILSATWLEAVTDNGYPGSGWTVRIPQSNVTAFERRQLSWWRTAIVVGGVAVGTWLGFESLGLGENTGDGGGGTPQPD